MSTQMEEEYKEKYGNVPFDSIQRISYMLDDMNLSRSKIDVFEEANRICGIKWHEIKFVVYLVPKATPRPRMSGRGVFYVKGAGDNKRFFKKYVKNLDDITIITTPVKFYCSSYLPIPNAMKPAEKILAELGFILPVTKPDWDNLAKTYCDMIQGTLIYDDSLIVEGHSVKRYSSKPRIEITLEYMDDYDSEFNLRKIEKTMERKG